MVSFETAKSYYDTLELPECASSDSIKKKYRELALRLHPDKNYDNPTDASLRFSKVTAAYEQLSNASTKAEIDAVLEHQSSMLKQLQLAATLRHSNAMQDFEASLMRRRQMNRSYSTGNNKNHSNGAPSSPQPSTTPPAAPPSQYTPEQTAYFRQREKQREKDLQRKQELEKKEQLEMELERVRREQEDRFRDEEKRSKEARARLEKAEATLFQSTSGLSRVSSMRNAAVGGATDEAAAAAAEDHKVLKRGLSGSASLRRSNSANKGNNGSATPRDSSQGRRESTAPLSSSSATSTPLSPLERGPPTGSSTSPGGTTPLASSSSNLSSSFSSVPQSVVERQQRDRFERLRRERERQDEIRRGEQEKYFERRLQEVRAREAKRVQAVMEEEKQRIEREVELLLIEEDSERHQCLLMEEELERRAVAAEFRARDTALRTQQRHQRIAGDEGALRVRIERLEEKERQSLECSYRWGADRALLEAAAHSSMFFTFHTAYHFLHSHLIPQAQCERDEIYFRVLMHQLQESFERRHLHFHFTYHTERLSLVEKENSARVYILSEVAKGVDRQKLLSDWFENVLEATKRAETLEWRLLTQVLHPECLMRQQHLDAEVRSACFLQKEKGETLQRLWVRRERVMEAIKGEAEASHRKEIADLTNEIARLHEALAKATAAAAMNINNMSHIEDREEGDTAATNITDTPIQPTAVTTRVVEEQCIHGAVVDDVLEQSFPSHSSSSSSPLLYPQQQQHHPHNHTNNNNHMMTARNVFPSLSTPSLYSAPPVTAANAITTSPLQQQPGLVSSPIVRYTHSPHNSTTNTATTTTQPTTTLSAGSFIYASTKPIVSAHNNSGNGIRSGGSPLSNSNSIAGQQVSPVGGRGVTTVGRKSSQTAPQLKK